MDLRKEIFDGKGFVILENVFSKMDIARCHRELFSLLKKDPSVAFKNAGGLTMPNFMRLTQLKLLSGLKDNPKIHEALSEIFGGSDEYRFCGHNDIGINRKVGWHKDKLNGKYSKFQKHNIYSVNPDGEKHEIIKVLIYLQDHSNNNHGLKIVPHSQNTSKIDGSKFVQLKPKLGDVIIFDQRITHRGQARAYPGTRVLLAFGFGRKNIFTDEFEKGTVLRQDNQNKGIF